MNGDLHQLLLTLREWDHRADPDVLRFLAGRGVITPHDLRRLDSPTPPPRPGRAADTDGRPPHATNGDPTSDLRGGLTQVGTGPARRPVTPTRYPVVRLHQTGGLGQVWLARDAVVGRDVALKTLRPDRDAHPSVVARFVREARVTGQLEHPCIVPLYDMGGGADPFYVMRFVSGQTLSAAAADYHRRRADGSAGRLDLAALLDAFVAVCRAVAFAHSRGVLHRDLKGDNVVVGEFGETFLLDWGLAKSIDDPDDVARPPARDTASELTDTGAAVGTPAYMAPEVVAGEAASKAADVYGLGATLYALLTGHPPYAGTTAVDVFTMVTTTEPDPVRARNPAAPPALEAVCRTAMARDPADRYASADELATEVRRWLADEPVAAYRERWPARAARWGRRRKAAVVAAGVALLTVTAASAVAAGLVWREQRETRQALDRAEADAATATTIVNELSEFVRATESAGNARSAQGDRERKKSLDASLAAYNRLLALRPDDATVRLNVARMYRYRGNLARLLNETADAAAAYREAAGHFDALVAADPAAAGPREDRVLLTREHSGLLAKLGRLADAGRVLDDAVARFDDLQRSRPTDPGLRRTRAGLLLERADLDAQLGRPAESERAAAESLALYDALVATPTPLDPMLAAMAQLRLALARREQGRTDAALADHDAAVERLARLPPTRDTQHQLHRARTERAGTWARLPDRRERAVEDLGGAIVGWEKLATDYPLAAFYAHWQGVARTHRGRLHLLLGRRDRAVADLTAAVALLDGLAAKYPDIPAYGYDLGRAYAAMGEAADPAAAAGWADKARGRLRAAAAENPESAPYRKALAELDGRPRP